MIKSLSITVLHKTRNFLKFRLFQKNFLRKKTKTKSLNPQKFLNEIWKKISQTKSFKTSKPRAKHTIEIFQTLIFLCHMAKKAEGFRVTLKNRNLSTVNNNTMCQWSTWIISYMIIIYKIIILIIWWHLKHNRAFMQFLICQNSSKTHYGMCFFTLPRTIAVAFLVTSPLFLFIRWTRALTFFSFLNLKIHTQAKPLF